MLVAREAAVEHGRVGAISVVYEHLFRHVSCLFLLRCKVSKIIVCAEAVTDFFPKKYFSCVMQRKRTSPKAVMDSGKLRFDYWSTNGRTLCSIPTYHSKEQSFGGQMLGLSKY